MVPANKRQAWRAGKTVSLSKQSVPTGQQSPPVQSAETAVQKRVVTK